ncbi:MAG: Acetyltransferase, GNAT family [uncultured Propionibacteriaceae bacterium]|uniref:Acetyltransferase, GNAT family n=1 Tax=uncultured Propionibacteriaceae bacterium TaxID=257457 RepID=A0A6J4NR87_9ACTN|nr:MAG: Acetyltransferase, GNAT family [uncultured Propionibacteriaceae bacterium]
MKAEESGELMGRDPTLDPADKFRSTAEHRPGKPGCPQVAGWLDGSMTLTEAPLPFPDCVPTLTDVERTVTLRAHGAGDLDALVEQCNDPATRLWTTVPISEGGYTRADAEGFALRFVPQAWAAGRTRLWAIEAEIDSRRRFCGSIDLRLRDNAEAEVGFGLHPAARGRSVMSTALRIVVKHGFDDLGLQVIRWRARVGNWPSRRVAAAAGFRFDGMVRGLLVHRGQRFDGWVATITSADTRAALPWLDPPVLRTTGLILRPFSDADVPRIVAATTDPRTQHWLVSLPDPYRVSDARAYVEATRELAARDRGLVWCVSDATSDLCIGAVSVEGFGGYARRREIGYWAHPAARGRGVMTTAVGAVTRYVEDNDLADSLLIRCAVGNAASRHVAEAAGYSQIGIQPRCEPLRDGSMSDLVLYSRP